MAASPPNAVPTGDEPGVSRFFDIGFATPGRSCEHCARPWRCEDGKRKDLGARCLNWARKAAETMPLPGM